MGTIAEGGVGGDCEVCRRSGGVSVFQTTRRKGVLLGCGNKGVTRSFFSFLSFSPRLNIPTLTISQQTLRYTLPSSRFPSTCPLLTHLSSSNLFFKYPKLRPILAFLLGLDHPVRTKTQACLGGKKERRRRKTTENKVIIKEGA